MQSDPNSLGLPDEVLERIFMFLLLDCCHPFPYKGVRSTCRLWNRISSLRRLHKIIYHPRPGDLDKIMSFTAEQIPVSLSLRLLQLPEVLPLVLAILHRISSLDLEGPGACNLLNEVELSNLRMTRLSLHNDIDEFLPITPSSVFTPDTELTLVPSGAPQLRSLSLQGYCLSLKSPLLCTALVRLELVCLENDSWPEEEKYELSSLLDYLYQMPSLREVVLRRVLSEDKPAALPFNFCPQTLDHLEKLVMEAQRPRGMPIYQLLSKCLPNAGRHIERHFIMNARHIAMELELPPFVDTDVLSILVASTTMLRLQFHGIAPTDDRPRLSEIVLHASGRNDDETLSSKLNSLLKEGQLKGPVERVKTLRIVEQERPNDSPRAESLDFSTIDWARPLRTFFTAVTHLSVSTTTRSNLEAFIRSIDIHTSALIPIPKLTELVIVNDRWKDDAEEVIPPLRNRWRVSVFLNSKTHRPVATKGLGPHGTEEWI